MDITTAPRRAGILSTALVALSLAASAFATWRTVGSSHEARPEDHTPPATVELGPIHPVAPILVNLEDPTHFIKTTIHLELTSADATATVERSAPAIRDAALLYLSGLTVADTRGEKGMAQLRADLLAKFSGIVGPGLVRRVYFQELFVK